MTTKILNARMINEGQIREADLLIEDRFISRIDQDLSSVKADQTIDAAGLHLLPGLIDDQVHFREPGLTHKAEIFTEARAAVAGGITSFMEMPNTVPNVLNQQLLSDKYGIAAERSLANYSFFMGVSNDNLEEVLKTDPKQVCGIKIFMGSSTGNMLVDDERTLRSVFKEAGMLIATHCEDETTIRQNTEEYRQRYGEEVPIEMHPKIRSAEACYRSSSLAVELAREYHTKLHILHISTARETALFGNDKPLSEKHITAEACIHHLWFDESSYADKGTFIKWNPAVKSAEDRAAVMQAVIDDRIDVIATDHAPHTLEEKSQTYFKAPSGGPLVQHSLAALLEMYHQGRITLEKIVEKACHNPAILFEIDRRGFVREGYYADLVLVDLNHPWEVSRANVLAKCGWSPFEGEGFRSQVMHTLVSGHLAYSNGKFNDTQTGMRLVFDR
jgi:dihydroorotase